MRGHGVRDTLGAGSDQPPDHLFGGNRWQAEGQAGRHLDRVAHAHAASAVFVLQVAVDAFGNSFATIPAPVGRMPHFRPVLWTASEQSMTIPFSGLGSPATGTVIHFCVRAKDEANNQGDLSNDATATVP
jgi:hypothetical protein